MFCTSTHDLYAVNIARDSGRRMLLWEAIKSHFTLAHWPAILGVPVLMSSSLGFVAYVPKSVKEPGVVGKFYFLTVAGT